MLIDRQCWSHAQDLASTQKRRSWFTGADVCRGRKARMVEVIGTIGSCREQHQAVEAIQSGHPDEIMMVAGYCHTSMETYIEPVSLRIIPSPPITRLLEADLVGKRRELVEAPAASGLPGVFRLPSPWLSLWRRGMRPLISLSNPGVSDDVDRLAKRSSRIG
jgi:hypothetical protein